MRSTEVTWSARFRIDFDRMFEAVRNTRDVPEEAFALPPYNIAMRGEDTETSGARGVSVCVRAAF
jgi:hypothetical protein